MTNVLLARKSASVTEFKRDPMGTMRASEGEPMVVLNRNTPAFYAIPVEAYEEIMERLDDKKIREIAAERRGTARIPVALDDL
jgi:antitoxin StbD